MHKHTKNCGKNCSNSSYGKGFGGNSDPISEGFARMQGGENRVIKKGISNAHKTKIKGKTPDYAMSMGFDDFDLMGSGKKNNERGIFDL